MREGVQPTNLGKGVGLTMPPPQPTPDASVFTAKSTLPLEAAKELNCTLSTGKCLKVGSRLYVMEDRFPHPTHSGKPRERVAQMIRPSILASVRTGTHF